MKNEFLEALGSNNANNNTDLSLYRLKKNLTRLFHAI